MGPIVGFPAANGGETRTFADTLRDEVARSGARDSTFAHSRGISHSTLRGWRDQARQPGFDDVVALRKSAAMAADLATLIVRSAKFTPVDLAVFMAKLAEGTGISVLLNGTDPRAGDIRRELLHELKGDLVARLDEIAGRTTAPGDAMARYRQSAAPAGLANVLA